MAEERLLIEIDAKASGAVKEIQDVNKALGQTPQVAAKAAAGINQISKATANATPALINFGRVIQDAPFGLIGIANNIDPLISSFQTLKSQSGSTGAAFKALAGSLIGPAGIGIAVSAVTSLLIALGPKLFGASKEAKALDEALSKAAASASQDLVKLQLYSSFAADASKATEERRKAVKALKDEYPQYLKDISDEAILTGQATEAISKSIDAILKRATVKLLQDDIAKAVEETAKSIIRIQKATIDATTAFENQQKAFKGSDDEFERQAQAAIQAGRAIGDVTREYSALNNQAERANANRPDEQIRHLKEQLQQLVAPLLKITDNFSDFGEKTKLGVEKAKKSVQQFIELTKLIGVTSTGIRETQILEIVAKLRTDQARKDLTNFVKQVQAQESGAIVIPVKIGPITVPLSDANAKIAQYQADLQALVQNFEQSMTASIQRTIASGLSAVGEGIGNLISGAADPFQAFFQVISGAMKEMGEALIAFGVAKIALDKMFKGPQGGPLAIAAGVGLVALSTAIKNWTGPKLAEGGIVNGPTLAMVGDNPGKKEAIIPIEKWDQMRGSDGPVVLDTRISGMDLLLIQRRAQASFARTNG